MEPPTKENFIPKRADIYLLIQVLAQTSPPQKPLLPTPTNVALAPHNPVSIIFPSPLSLQHLLVPGLVDLFSCTLSLPLEYRLQQDRDLLFLTAMLITPASTAGHSLS